MKKGAILSFEAGGRRGQKGHTHTEVETGSFDFMAEETVILCIALISSVFEKSPKLLDKG